jgi:hypothetical protein
MEAEEASANNADPGWYQYRVKKSHGGAAAPPYRYWMGAGAPRE